MPRASGGGRLDVISITMRMPILLPSIIAISCLQGAEPVDAPQEAAHSAAFALDLYRRVQEQAPADNRCLSPFSIRLALAMAGQGARGATADELGTALRTNASGRRGPDPDHPWDFASVLSAGRETVGRMTANGRDGPTFTLANSLWAEKSAVIDRGFLAWLTGSGADVLRCDFRDSAERERQRINRAVADQTRDRIRDLLPPGSLTGNTRMVITNAIFFLGIWDAVFPPAATAEEPFRSGARTVTADMLHRQASYVYGAFNRDGSVFAQPANLEDGASDADPRFYPAADGLEVLLVPYRGETAWLQVILPRSPSGLADLERRLTPELLRRLDEGLRPRGVDVKLPRFRLDMPDPLAVKPALMDMGIRKAFSDGDFSGLLKEPGVHIDEVFHQTFIRVDEEGTEAAAATAVIGVAMAAPVFTRPFVARFYVDRPFLFLLRERTGGEILFMGRIGRPDLIRTAAARPKP